MSEQLPRTEDPPGAAELNVRPATVVGRSSFNTDAFLGSPPGLGSGLCSSARQIPFSSEHPDPRKRRPQGGQTQKYPLRDISGVVHGASYLDTWQKESLLDDLAVHSGAPTGGEGATMDADAFAAMNTVQVRSSASASATPSGASTPQVTTAGERLEWTASYLSPAQYRRCFLKLNNYLAQQLLKCIVSER